MAIPHQLDLFRNLLFPRVCPLSQFWTECDTSLTDMSVDLGRESSAIGGRSAEPAILGHKAIESLPDPPRHCDCPYGLRKQFQSHATQSAPCAKQGDSGEQQFRSDGGSRSGRRRQLVLSRVDGDLGQLAAPAILFLLTSLVAADDGQRRDERAIQIDFSRSTASRCRPITRPSALRQRCSLTMIDAIRSESAPIVRDGLSPSGVGTIAPSATNRFL
jgi:hypothetical protein